MKKNKLVYLIAILIIIIGIIVACTMKFKLSLDLSDSTKINLYIKKEMDTQDVRKIVSEIFGKDNIVKKVGNFNDMLEIKVQDVTDEQKANFVSKINEKYEVELKEEENIIISKVSHIRIRDMVKNYIVPVSIVTAIVLIYMGIRYKRLGAIKVMINMLITVVLVEGVYISLIVISRLPINKYTIPTGIVIGAVTLIAICNKKENMLNENKKEKNNQEK